LFQKKRTYFPVSPLLQESNAGTYQLGAIILDFNWICLRIYLNTALLDYSKAFKVIA